MVILNRYSEENVTDVRTIEEVVYNAINKQIKFSLFGIPIWNNTIKVTIPEVNTKNKKEKQIGF